MPAAVITFDVGALEQLRARFKGLDLADEAAPTIGALVEAQTRQRIIDGGPAPNGDAWDDWSESYARTRHANHSLLRNEGHLLDSIEHQVRDGRVTVGAYMEYAAVHQYGAPSKRIPARPFLGISAENSAEIRQAILDAFGGAWRDA